MNAEVVKALFLDALYQVLDNKVFRILAGVVLALVLATFLVGARDDALVLLFGWKEIFYEDIFAFFNMPYPGVEGAGEILVQRVQQILVDGLAGSLGIMFAIAATAFFVPRMLEKGAADTLFSKPVSRFALLLSRYCSGLLFVAILALVLVGGMHVGFLLNSGYSDPGFLWSILTLIYVFALLHGFSILVGVLTRSTVASILLTLVFMLFTGCVHRGWQGKEMFLDHSTVERLRQDEEVPPEELTEGEVAARSEDEASRWRDLLFLSIDAIHYTLPKTTDATAIARKMRRDLEHRYAELWDPAGGFLIAAPPSGWERREGPEELDGEGMSWALPDGRATMRLTRRSAKGTTRLRAAKALRISLESRPEVSNIEEQRGFVANTQTSRLDWVETGPQGERLHRAHVFIGGGQLYTLEIEGTREWQEDRDADKVVQVFVRGFTFNEGVNATDPFSRFENLFGWDAPLAYNIFFSIGSSLAFLAVVLAIAWWRLARIDF
jgi:ABC-type transport system involved in multi-copper enzyme maturation permease subunit